jgi:ribosome-binding factor A
MPNGSRLAKINEEIMREMGLLIPRLKDPRVKGLVSVTRVDTTRDMRHARIYISVLQGDSGDVVSGLTSAAGFLRRELGQVLALRMTPELQFLPDDSIERGVHVLDVLRDISEKESR